MSRGHSTTVGGILLAACVWECPALGLSVSRDAPRPQRLATQLKVAFFQQLHNKQFLLRDLLLVYFKRKMSTFTNSVLRKRWELDITLHILYFMTGSIPAIVAVSFPLLICTYKFLRPYTAGELIRVSPQGEREGAMDAT